MLDSWPDRKVKKVEKQVSPNNPKLIYLLGLAMSLGGLALLLMVAWSYLTGANQSSGRVSALGLMLTVFGGWFLKGKALRR